MLWILYELWNGSYIQWILFYVKCSWQGLSLFTEEAGPAEYYSLCIICKNKCMNCKSLTAQGFLFEFWVLLCAHHETLANRLSWKLGIKLRMTKIPLLIPLLTSHQNRHFDHLTPSLCSFWRAWYLSKKRLEEQQTYIWGTFALNHEVLGANIFSTFCLRFYNVFVTFLLVFIVFLLLLAFMIGQMKPDTPFFKYRNYRF